MKYTKKALALFLAICMMFTAVPFSTNAEEAAQQVTAAVENVVADTEEVFVETDAVVEEDVSETEEMDTQDESVVSETETITEPVVVENDAVMTLGLEDEDIATYAATTTEYPIYVLAGGDYQQAGDHANSAENVANILAQVSQKYTEMDGFLFIGDYDCETHDDATETANGIASLMDTVDNTYSDLNHANSVLVQGNHDYKDSNIDATGGHVFDGYSVYVLNEDDYPNGGGSLTQIQNLADNLETWLSNKLGEGYDSPVFVTSHLPLAFSPRTVTQGDAKYAKLIFDVLNTAADNGLNIIFMHGHDHAYGPDNYMGGEAIYLPEGDKIAIAETGSTSAYTWETLNFTYMNAGYTGYYSDPYTYKTDAGTDKLTMTVFKIESNQVTVERYSANGLYNLKSAGYDGSYSNTSVTNQSLELGRLSTVYTSPQTISLGNVETYGTIGEYVGVEAETTADDVKTENKGWVELIKPVLGTTTGGTTTYQYIQDTDGVNADTGYLLVDSADATAMDNNMTSGITTVTLTAGESGKMIADSRDYEWKIDSSNRIYTTIDGSDYYLRLSIVGNNASLVLTSKPDNWRSPATEWTITNSNGQYTISNAPYGNYGYTYYLTESGISTTSGTVRLYSHEKDIVTGGTTTEDKNGTYRKIVGDLTYNATTGMTADEAMALVKAGIDGYCYEAMSTPGADVTGTKVEDSVLTWEWVDNFDGNTAGDYEVAIKYGDFLLGTAEVVVPAATTYYAAEGNGLYLVDMNTTEANAMAAVKAGVTVYSATDAKGTNKTAVSDSDVTWNWVDKYNGADSGPYTVEILKDGTSLGTVEVKVNIQYETEIETDWTYIGETEATGGSYTYTLDTDGIDYGEEHKYIIVDDNEAIVLNANNASNGTAHSIEINGNTATLDTRDYEYHMIRTNYNVTRYELITKGDGSQYLYQESNGVRYGTRSSVKFQVNHHGNGIYDIHDIDGTNWYIIYNGGWTVTETTSARVRLYKYTGTTGGTPAGSIYALIEGPTVYTVSQGSSATKALATVKAGITGYTATDANGTNKTELTDSDLTWKWKNTFNGNSTGSYWVEISYQGKVLGTVEVKVEPGVVNNYPEYPDEGAVKVNKTGTGIDFQSSGIAQVEVSASGVPIKKGADVIVMLDTSSSMKSHTVTGSSTTRAEVLEESLKNLIAQFKTPGDDGQLLDLRVAIADFNGFYGENHNASGTPYDRDAADMMSDDISYGANSEAKIYTGDGTLGAGAFIPVEDLAASYTLNYTSGTNYDYAMDAIYQMGTAIKEANTEDRDLYVIFMSDGAAMQWNYYHSQGASSLWNNWITGAWTANQLSLNCNTHAYYYDEVDHNGDGLRNEHRMANAIKGDPNKTYEVIRKTDTLGTPTDETNMYMVPGLGATMFSISFDAQADTNVTEESMDKSIASLASEQTGTTQYYYKVTNADELDKAFDAIGSEIAYAAYNARFVDQMGDDFDLRMKTSTYEVVENGDTTSKTLAPKIEIISYDIYTRQDYLNGTITEDKIGDRKGTYTILETVTFSADGTKAYSDQINGGETNILADGTQKGYVKGVIYAKTFLYNTNISEVAVDGVNIPTGTKTDGTTTGTANKLPSETFYWKMGTVQSSELAMRYYVYLEGSMEGTREAGSYPTNEYATLYYDNYLGNPCYKDTVSPVMAWKEANVSYAFYLVDENGDIIVNQTTGQTGSFANKIAVTNPVVYETVLLNNDEEVSSIDIASLGVLPEGYTLYDYNGTNGATYTVTINSNTTGSWDITSVKDVATTYVTQYDPSNASAYSNKKNVGEVGLDYTHTVVWFAVLWKVQALPDAVVIDYGLPVDISVLTNDMFGENGKLAGVGAYSDSLNLDGHGSSLASGFASSYVGTYGRAETNTQTGKVRYTPTSMEMTSYDKFAYVVNYTGNENAGYYYDTVTVIPATTIYYEDNFVEFDNLVWKSTGANAWEGEWAVVENPEKSIWESTSEDNDLSDFTQDEDRPGQYSLTDANNIYGYDSVNKSMSTFSLGSAMKATVDYDNAAQASFEFYGTGFDVISMTSNNTGAILVYVYPVNADGSLGEAVKSLTVDTYYGYKTESGDANGDGTIEEGEFVWVVDPEADASIYQVPVMKVEGLSYGHYRAVIQAVYEPIFEHVENSTNYDFYLDAIRIYDPANDGAGNTVIEDAYKADGEGWPSYIELRNKIIDAGSFDNVANDALAEDMEGLVFIDGDASVGNAQIADYISYGPNNEIYLAPGQRVAFMLSTPDNIANVHIGIKSADGKTGTYTITNISKAEKTVDNVKVNAGQYYNPRTVTIDTTTDMYYDLTDWKNDIIVISNTGNREGNNTTGIVSLTNIKSTYTSNPYATVTTSEEAAYGLSTASVDTEEVNNNETYMYMTPEAATLTLRSVNTPMEEETPDVEIPEEPENPDVENPDTEEPQPEKPESDIVTELINKIIDVIKDTVNGLFGWKEVQQQ